MKATGIIRRIDELGRIVIPKEFRRSLRIEEYDPLEIFTSPDGSIILKKYYPLSSLGNFIPEYADTLHWALGCDALICDKDAVIAAAGPNSKQYLEKELHHDLEKVINHGNSLCLNNRDVLNTISEYGHKNYSTQVITPICFNGDPIGAVILLIQQSTPETLNLSIKLADSIAYLISKAIDY